MVSIAARVCECCGQTLQDVREGVRLTPLKAKIFDIIKRQPGVTRKELCYEIYETVSDARVLTIAAHVNQIRDKFESTETLIFGKRHYGYRIEKRRLGRGLGKR